MAIPYIFPQQPDPYIRTQPNQGLVKFGHLNKVIDNINIQQEEIATQQALCCTFIMLGKQTLDFNTTNDQLVTLSITGHTFVISDIVITNASVSMSLAAHAVIWSQPSGTGNQIASTNGLAKLVTPLNFLSVSNGGIPANFGGNINTNLAGQVMYFSLGTPQGVAATADIYIFGSKLS